jgi:hypothetical protein
VTTVWITTASSLDKCVITPGATPCGHDGLWVLWWPDDPARPPAPVCPVHWPALRRSLTGARTHVKVMDYRMVQTEMSLRRAEMRDGVR